MELETKVPDSVPDSQASHGRQGCRSLALSREHLYHHLITSLSQNHYQEGGFLLLREAEELQAAMWSTELTEVLLSMFLRGLTGGEQALPKQQRGSKSTLCVYTAGS